MATAPAPARSASTASNVQIVVFPAPPFREAMTIVRMAAQLSTNRAGRSSGNVRSYLPTELHERRRARLVRWGRKGIP